MVRSHVRGREGVLKTMASPFETAYPNVARWVKSSGWIQIGRDEYGDSFVQAFTRAARSGQAAKPTRLWTRLCRLWRRVLPNG
jgi:hypothetical protein